MNTECINHYPRMTELARTFPTLHKADGVEPFDAEKLDAWACSGAPSHGGLYAARFILAMWSGRAGVVGKPRRDKKSWNGEWRFPINTSWRCGPFDIIDALGTWDDYHRSAFIEWAVNPWWL